MENNLSKIEYKSSSFGVVNDPSKSFLWPFLKKLNYFFQSKEQFLQAWISKDFFILLSCKKVNSPYSDFTQNGKVI